MKPKETQEKLLEALDLKVGDKVKIDDKIYTIVFYEYIELYALERDEKTFNIDMLVNYNCVKVEQPKLKGDLMCCDKICDGHCPLQTFDCNYGKTLFEILENRKEEMPQKVYDAYMEILNEATEDE